MAGRLAASWHNACMPEISRPLLRATHLYRATKCCAWWKTFKVLAWLQDPFHYDKYVSSNVFLADLNNEHAAKNEQYKKNMQSLDKLVLFRFTEDLLVVPRDSAWFGYFNGSTLQPMEDTQLYQVSSGLFCAGLRRDMCCSLSL